MKILGSVIIVVACALSGYEIHAKALKKLRFIEGLISGLEFYKSEMIFAHTLLSDTFLKCASISGEACVFFETLGNELKKEGVVLESVFDKYSKQLKTYMNNDVFSIIRDTTLQLGTNDAENQKSLVESAVEKLSCCRVKQQSFCNREGIMCKKISVVAGVAVSLILF